MKEIFNSVEKGLVVSLKRQKAQRIGGTTLICMCISLLLFIAGGSVTIMLTIAIIKATEKGEDTFMGPWYYYLPGPLLIVLGIVVSCCMSKSKKKRREDKTQKDMNDVIEQWNNSGKLPRGYFLALGQNFWKNAIDTWYQNAGPLNLLLCVNVSAYQGNVSFDQFPRCRGVYTNNEIY